MDKKQIKKYLEESLNLQRIILKDVALVENIVKAIDIVKNCLRRGNKILIAGNGGSAADAQHFAAELVCRYKKGRKGYAAIALTTDTSIITAWSNDYDFKTVFARQIEALGKPNDVFFGISTSGNSPNIIEAVKKAKKNKIKTICLLGNDGGQLNQIADINLIVPSQNTPRIQEIHTLLIHIICEEVENTLK